MKGKFVLLITLILVFALVGCSNESTSQRTKQTGLEIKSELKDGDTTKTQAENLKFFDEIYDGTHLVPVINYFDENYGNFSEDEKNKFAQEICNTLQKQKLNLADSINSIGPPTARYDFYADSTLYVNINGDKSIVDTLSNLDTELYTLARRFWATEDEGTQDEGFTLTVHPHIADKLRKALDIVYPKEIPQYYSLEPIVIPNVHNTSKDEPFNSYDAVKGYAQVYIEELDQLKLFANNENVWKTIVVLPVKVEMIENYLANTSYTYDFSGKGKPEEIRYLLNNSQSVLQIGNSKYDFVSNQFETEFIYNEFKIVEGKIFFSQAAPPMDNYLHLFKYDGKDIIHLGKIPGDLNDLEKDIQFAQDGSIKIIRYSNIMDEGVYQTIWKYEPITKTYYEAEAEKIKYYLTPISSKTNTNVSFYEEQSIESESQNIEAGAQLLVLGEKESWLLIEYNNSKWWIDTSPFRKHFPDENNPYEIDKMKFLS